MLAEPSRVVAPEAPEEPSARPSSAAAVSGHIAGLDGVRAFAVVAVVAFHLWPARLPGGFLGVDVFFVISGFLITTLLVREDRGTGRIDFPSFWLRRARRLLPALVLVVAVAVVAAWVVSRDLLVGVDRQSLGALTFSTNWLEVDAGADYFNHTAPLLFAPFWSLAVEEQFYLLWPLVLLAILTFARPGWSRVRLPLGAALVSAVLMALWFSPGANPTRVYYGTDTHLFGLMVGAALALAFADRVGVIDRGRWQPIRRWAGFLAMAALLFLVVALRSESALTYRGGLLLASLLSAVVIACLPGPPTVFTALHRVRPLAWIGERSYGIYLWHWPVILVVAAARPAIAPGSPPDTTTVVLSIAVTLGLAAASYRWVEVPIRRHGLPGLGRVLGARPLGWLAAGALLVSAAVIVATAPAKSRAQLAVEAGERAIAEQGAGPTSAATPAADAPAWPPRQRLPQGDRIVALGDSVLSGAAPALYERFPGVLIEAEPIRQWRDAPALVQEATANGTLRPVVILQFGTNAGLESEESRAGLTGVLDELGSTPRVVLVNVTGVSYWVPSSNDHLAEIASGRGNVAVADWHAVVEADPELLQSDRTHPTTAGNAAYADLLAATIQALGPGP